jgi:uncharacterized protein with LGFP repeats
VSVADPALAEQTTVQTPDGAFVIRGRIYAKWRALKDERSPDGDDVQAHLELPLGEQAAVPVRHGGGAMQLFRRGVIVERAHGATFVVYGAIYDRYVALGGPASPLGQPTSDEEPWAFGGRVAHFEHGDIYWREDAGPREALGARRQRYRAGADPFARSWPSRIMGALRTVRRALAEHRSR